jgi:F-type H+-transporting ATPase subunit gamma
MVSFAERFLSAWNVPVQIITVGRKGRDLMIRRGYNVVASFDEIPDSPSILDVTPISQLVTDDFLSGKVDQVFIGYTDFINLIARRPTVKQLLPLKPTDFSDMAVSEYVSTVDLTGVSERVYTFEPGPEELLDTVVPRFTDLQVYQSILESQASEHSARYVAMNNATDNAAELVEILTLERNKARQTSITSEILDIVGGAEALAQNS